MSAPDKATGSYRFERGGWIFVHLEGEPARVGYQHGFLLSAEIQDLLRVIKPFLQETSKKDWAFYRDVAEKILWPGIDEEYRAELDGIVAGLAARGVQADRWDIVALNSIEEIPGYYVPWLNKQQGKPPVGKAPGNCSAFIATGAWTKDQKIVIGHNAWTNYITGERWNIIFDIAPAKGHRILMDGLPGIITSSDDFGVNDAGIVITETTITGFEGFDPKGTPEFYRARKAMQYAESIDDYVRIMLDRNNGGYANDWLVGDNKTGEIALFELGLKNWTVDRTKSGYFVGAELPGEAEADEGRDDVRPDEPEELAQRAAHPLGTADGAAQGEDRRRAGQGLRGRRVRRDHEEGRPERADAVRRRRRRRRAGSPSGTGGRTSRAAPCRPR